MGTKSMLPASFGQTLASQGESFSIFPACWSALWGHNKACFRLGFGHEKAARRVKNPTERLPAVHEIGRSCRFRGPFPRTRCRQPGSVKARLARDIQVLAMKGRSHTLRIIRAKVIRPPLRPARFPRTGPSGRRAAHARRLGRCRTSRHRPRRQRTESTGCSRSAGIST